MTQLSQLSTRCKFWIIGKEVGIQGTRHLQCYFNFKNQTRFSTIKKACPRGHWEKAKGNVQQNYTYCSKDGDFTTNIEKKYTLKELKEMVLKEYEGVVWRPWQTDLMALVDKQMAEKDKRSIIWVFEPSGRVGKSYLTKYLCVTRAVILCGGKKADIFNQVATAVQAGELPTLVIADIPRVGAQYVSYEALESLKNGCFYSGKYEGAQCVFPSPIVVCFANVRPLVSAMSSDRWKIFEIKDGKLFAKSTPVLSYS